MDCVNESMAILEAAPDVREVLVKRVHPLRFAAEQGREGYSKQFAGFNSRH